MRVLADRKPLLFRSSRNFRGVFDIFRVTTTPLSLYSR
jgi:hypothetical protein